MLGLFIIPFYLLFCLYIFAGPSMIIFWIILDNFENIGFLPIIIICLFLGLIHFFIWIKIYWHYLIWTWIQSFGLIILFIVGLILGYPSPNSFKNYDSYNFEAANYLDKLPGEITFSDRRSYASIYLQKQEARQIALDTKKELQNGKNSRQGKKAVRKFTYYLGCLNAEKAKKFLFNPSDIEQMRKSLMAMDWREAKSFDSALGTYLRLFKDHAEVISFDDDVMIIGISQGSYRDIESTEFILYKSNNIWKIVEIPEVIEDAFK